MSRWKEVKPVDPVNENNIRFMAQGSIVRKCEIFSFRERKGLGKSKVAARLWVKKRNQWTWVRWHYWPVFKTEKEASQVALQYFQQMNPEPDY